MATADIANDTVVCHCLGITESAIRDAMIVGTAECLRSVMRETGAGTGCTACHRAIKNVLAEGQLRVQCSASSSPTCVTR